MKYRFPVDIPKQLHPHPPEELTYSRDGYNWYYRGEEQEFGCIEVEATDIDDALRQLANMGSGDE